MTPSKWLTLAVVAGVVLVLAYSAGRETGRKAEKLKTDEAIAKAAQVVRDSAGLATRAALLKVEQGRPRVEAAHRSAGILGPNTVIIREEGRVDTVHIPGQVVERLVQDSLHVQRLEVANAALRVSLAADSSVIKAHVVVIADLKAIGHPRCGKRCGFVLGSVSVVGLAWGVNQMRR